MLEGEIVIDKDEKLEAMTGAINRLAHDYNNFLAAVEGYTELILRETPSASQTASDLGEIKTVCDKMAALNKKLLSFARRKSPLTEEINLCELIDQNASYFSKKCQNHIFKVSKNDVFLKGSSDQITELISHLLENACLFSPEKSEIELGCSYEGKNPFLFVRDHGPGFPDNPVRFFYPYETTKSERLGLGLSCAYGIAMRHKAFFRIIKTSEHNEIRTVFEADNG